MNAKTHLQSDFRSPRNLLLLAGFVAVVVAVGGLIGSQTAPGAWYAALDKPPFNPPNWVFGPVWFTLYVLIGFAGWRTFVRSPKSVQMRLWVAQMLLNWIWPPVFFGAENLWLALAVIVPMLATIIGFIGTSWPRNRPAALAFVPYLLWVAFATLLNFSLAILN